MSSRAEVLSVFYKRSNSLYGSQQPETLAPPRFGLSNKFSKAAASGGNWRKNGLNTKVDYRPDDSHILRINSTFCVVFSFLYPAYILRNQPHYHITQNTRFH